MRILYVRKSAKYKNRRTKLYNTPKLKFKVKRYANQVIRKKDIDEAVYYPNRKK